MLGAIIGDIVGSTREHRNIKSKNFELLPAGSRATDDSVMTIAVAMWLTIDDEHNPENLIRCMQQMGRMYPNAGYGGKFRNWLKSDKPAPYYSWGNGSGMRVSPCALYAKTIDEALNLAKISAAVTHNHHEGIKGAQAIAAAVFMAKQGNSKAEIKNYIEKKFGYNLNRTLDEIRPGYIFDVSCQGSCPEAIIAYLESTDFEDAIRNAISLGGDSDTIGAMTGAIAAAEYGIPTQIAEVCEQLLPDRLRKTMKQFEEKLSMSAESIKYDAVKTAESAAQNINLNRFLTAQDSPYSGYITALKEMERGGKFGHWIWYIFPQIEGLGVSGMSQHFGIKGKEEATAYLKHPILGTRLREITNIVLGYPEGSDPKHFMGSTIDAIKLKSSMTLFNEVAPDDIFALVLNKFFDGKRCQSTLNKLNIN